MIVVREKDVKIDLLERELKDKYFHSLPVLLTCFSLELIYSFFFFQDVHLRVKQNSLSAQDSRIMCGVFRDHGVVSFHRHFLSSLA